jgi:hypothetical protein
LGVGANSRAYAALGRTQRQKGYSHKKLTALLEWQRSKAEANKLQAQGFGDLQGPPPVLCEAASQAIHCWQFCAGWAPERWVVYGALFEVTDWHLLIELMQEIKANV